MEKGTLKEAMLGARIGAKILMKGGLLLSFVISLMYLAAAGLFDGVIIGIPIPSEELSLSLFLTLIGLILLAGFCGAIIGMLGGAVIGIIKGVDWIQDRKPISGLLIGATGGFVICPIILLLVLLFGDSITNVGSPFRRTLILASYSLLAGGISICIGAIMGLLGEAKTNDKSGVSLDYF